MEEVLIVIALLAGVVVASWLWSEGPMGIIAIALVGGLVVSDLVRGKKQARSQRSPR